MFISIDVESDGPCPGKHNMVCFGAVIVERGLNRTFYGRTAPMWSNYIPEALEVSGFSRKEHEAFPKPATEMIRFKQWLDDNSDGKRWIMVSDNPAYDFQWMNYYSWVHLNENPLGHSARRIGDIYSGLHRDLAYKWRHNRTTKHDHNPVNDALGNAEAFLQVIAAFRQR